MVSCHDLCTFRCNSQSYQEDLPPKVIFQKIELLGSLKNFIVYNNDLLHYEHLGPLLVTNMNTFAVS
ncbi:hypothetical protein Dimus_035521 [Dionaea muscipula]